MEVGIRKETLIKEYSNSLKNGNASLFIGSGISRKANYVGWKDILRDCAKDIGLDVEKEKDLITLAQYYIRDNQKTKITETIKDFFADRNGNVQDIHRIIASFPLHNIWTTNYDTLIERAFEKARISTTVITDDESYKDIDREAKVKIHKIHGSIKNVSKCIIARQDYDLFPQTHDIVLSELKGEMCSNSFLFLGYSFSDTDIQHILTRIRLAYENAHPQRHFCIMERIKPKSGETEEEFKYKETLQKHYVSDMQSYGINVLLVDSYDEIEGILLSIRDKVYAENVQVSGAYDNDESLSSRISSIATKISSTLILKGFKIYTGYGKNLGADIINGAYEGCTKADKKAKEFNSNVFIFPFPYRQRKTKAREELYSDIRLHLASLTKIMIIIAGKTNGRNSQGTYDEYRLANDNHNIIIPIATTGGTARQVWDELNTVAEYKNLQSFQKLNTETSPDKVSQIVLDMINESRGE